MDQCADRCRPFHCVGQPDVKRELPGFTNRAAKNQKRDEGDARPNFQKTTWFQRAVTIVIKEKGAAAVIQPKYTEEEAEIANSRGNESLLCGGSGARPFDPEPDQQVGGESNELPANEKQKQTICDN